MLADGAVCLINETASIIHTINEKVAAIKSCPHSDQAVMRTVDNRFINCLNDGKSKDITSAIDDSLSPYREDLADIRDLIVSTDGIAIRTTKNLTYINLEKNQTMRYAFGSEISMASFGKGRGFARVDDQLWVLATEKTNRARKANLPDAHDIKDIVCGPHYTIIQMHDGRIRAHINAYSDPATDADDIYESVVFPEDEFIVKIVPGRDSVVYIGLKGTCYYSDVKERHTHSLLNPRPILALKDYCVEDVSITKLAIMVIHDGGRVCMLSMVSESCFNGFYWLEYHLDEYYLDWKKPLHLDHFDHKPIVSITPASEHVNPDSERIFFVADDGSVYNGKIEGGNRVGSRTHIETVTRIPFFDTRPVAGLHGSRRIKAAARLPTKIALSPT